MAISFQRRILLLSLATICGAVSVYAQRSTMVFMRYGNSHTAYMQESVDVVPQFPGGECEMIRFINNERNYPRQAYEAGIEGRVRCGFIVDSDGSITNVTVHRGSAPELNNEAVRIIEKMPRWKAGKVDGESVPVYYLLTIPFRL